MTEATVIIAAWNAERFISKSIASSLKQKGLRVKVVVIDDASDDRTSDVVAAFDGVQCKRLDRNGGPSKARNTGFDISDTEWIAVLDSDDTMAPDRLKNMIDLAEQCNADIVLGNVARVTEQGDTCQNSDFLEGSNMINGAKVTLSEYLAQNQFTSSDLQTGYLKPVFRSSLLKSLSLKYDESLRNSEDFHIVLRAIALGAKVVISTEPEYYYTVREGSISHRVDPEKLIALQKADTAFFSEFEATLCESAKAMFHQRQSSLRKVIEGEVVMGHIKRLNFAAAIMRLVRKPDAIPRVINQLGEAVSNRLRTGP